MNSTETLVPLPPAAREALAGGGGPRHPGLALDKYAVSVQRDPDGALQGRLGQPAYALELLEEVAKHHAGLRGTLRALEPRRRAMLDALRARTFRARTTWRLTLWLARASTLENAGLCLHPIHGFVYLPGSGLKGMARAWAETVWLPTREDRTAAWRTIEDVFGWAPNNKRKEQSRNPAHPARARREGDEVVSARAGAVVFHDAWPATLPTLVVDIVNNHHRRYYEQAETPGDWESPNPVYFLAVEAGAEFEFAISARAGAHEGSKLVARAEEFLRGALAELGAGAKTAAGYGHFALEQAEDPPLARFDGRPFEPPPRPRSRPDEAGGRDRNRRSTGRFADASESRATSQGPRAGDIVQATLLEEKTKKGGWKARYGAHSGPVILQPGAPGAEDWKPGQVVSLQIAAPPPNIQFRHPPRESGKKDKAGRSSPRPGRGPRGGGRRG